MRLTDAGVSLFSIPTKATTPRPMLPSLLPAMKSSAPLTLWMTASILSSLAQDVAMIDAIRGQRNRWSDSGWWTPEMPPTMFPFP